MKQTKLLVLMLAMLLPLFSNADPVEIDGIWYKLLSKGKVATVEPSPNKYSGDIIIPPTITYNGEEYDVVAIDNRAFYTCHGLSSLVIPETVTSLGYEVFWHCDNMVSLTIKGCITKCGSGSFDKKFEKLIITDLSAWCNSSFLDEADNVSHWPTHYCNHFYLNNEEIKDITIPDDVTIISDYTFYNVKSLESLTISKSVTSIGNNAFYGCKNLASLTIPRNVTQIGTTAFTNCTGLNSIIVEEGNPIYDSRNNCNAIIETSNNNLLLGCNKTIIPNNVASIGNSAFAGCSGLSSVTIPNSVTSIGSVAFNGCI